MPNAQLRPWFRTFTFPGISRKRCYCGAQCMSRKSVQRFCDNDMHKEQPEARRPVERDAL
ncbi:MAG: hypothetical protein E5X59_21885 [Mesorhizobium sp.]|nr:MAG: hypothetical protein E5X59_21885 [Mesorhizobium sp.]